MIKILHTHKQTVFYWLLFMVAIVLSFPHYSTASKFIIAFAFSGLFLMNSWSEKKQLFYKNKHVFLSISIFFFLSLLGTMYTDNLKGASSDIVHKLPFIIFPLVLFTIPIKQRTLTQTYRYFSYGVVASSLSALLKALYFKYYDLGNYLYYHEFTLFTGKHSTYYALFLVLAFLYFYQQVLIHKKQRILNGFVLLFLLLMLYVISNRISLISLAIGVVISTFPQLNKKAKFGFILLLLSGFVIMINTPSFKKRFSPNYLKAKKLSEFDLRKKHIKAVVITIAENNILIGKGTEASRENLYRKYKQYGYHDAYVFKYNAHNQFLEIGLNFGLLGVFSLLMALLYQLKIIIKSKNYFLLAVFFSIMTFMLTESILERQSGIVIFSLFMSILLLQAKQENIAE